MKTGILGHFLRIFAFDENHTNEWHFWALVITLNQKNTITGQSTSVRVKLFCRLLSKPYIWVRVQLGRIFSCNLCMYDMIPDQGSAAIVPCLGGLIRWQSLSFTRESAQYKVSTSPKSWTKSMKVPETLPCQKCLGKLVNHEKLWEN